MGQISYNHFFDKGSANLDFYYSNSNFTGNAKGFSRVYSYSSIQDSLNHIEHINVDNNIKDLL